MFPLRPTEGGRGAAQRAGASVFRIRFQRYCIAGLRPLPVQLLRLTRIRASPTVGRVRTRLACRRQPARAGHRLFRPRHHGILLERGQRAGRIGIDGLI